MALLNYQFDDDRSPPGGGHVEKYAADISEGFVDRPIGYACGDSGEAVSGGRHLRNFVYVPPGNVGDSVGPIGYWTLFDELRFDADTEPETVHTALHPNSAQTPTIRGDRFAATTPVGGPYPRTDTDVAVAIGYGTRPDDLQVRDGALAGADEGFVGKYLYATYETTEQ